MKELSLNLKRLRKIKNVSKSELARLLNIAPSAYSAYENGKIEIGDREPNLKNLIKLADFFKVSVDELLNYRVDEFERCKSLWELAGYEIQMQEGKIRLKQLELTKYFTQGKYGFAGYSEKRGINLLLYGQTPMIFDTKEDFLEFTQKMEKFCQKNFWRICRKFYWNATSIAADHLLDILGEEKFWEEEDTEEPPINYSLIKNDTLTE